MVNNAGVAIFTEIEWCSVTQFQRIMDVNVFGVVRVTKAFLPIVRQVNGRIVNVASLAGTYYMSFKQRMCVCVRGGGGYCGILPIWDARTSRQSQKGNNS